MSLGVTAIGFALILPAQTPAPVSPPAAIDATALVRRAVQHRLDADKNHRPMQYLLHVKDERHETTKEIVETKDGDVARLVAVWGKPLSVEADRAELARLDYLAAHPELQEHRKKSEQKDQARVDRLMAMLPDALLYKLEGVEACPSGQCYKLSYAPNPRWSPPDMEAKFLRGVAGEVWIDQKQERLTRLDAHFIENVDFGFGLLGKVNKGGTVVMEQTDAGGGEWELTSLKVNVTGDVLLVKTLSFQIVEEASGFARVPEMGYREAIALLKKGVPGASDTK
jgi:hypothetical protein